MRAIYALLLLTGCTVQVVAPFDSSVVTAGTKLVSDITTALDLQLYSKNPIDVTYDGMLSNYSKIDGEAQVLLALVESHENNAPEIAQAKTVITEIDALEKVHRDEGKLSSAFITDKQQALLMEITAIMRTETAKKVLGG